MSRRWMKLPPAIAVSLLAIALTLSGCDAGSGRDARSLLGPSVEAAYDQGSSVSYRRVRGRDGEGTISATIGVNGGRIAVGNHELIVPRGAVDAPTLFRLSLDDADHIQVHLTATRTLPDGTELNVGAQGFLLPVTLRLSFKDISEPVDPTRLMIIWVRQDGSFEPRASTVHPGGKRVEALLPHFSRYAVAIG